MIRFSTILLFLVILLVVFCIAIWNKLSVLDYVLQAARGDCLEGLLIKNKVLTDEVGDEKFARTIKKLSKNIDDDYRQGIEAQNTIDDHLAEYLQQTWTPKKWTSAYKALEKIADHEESLASKKRFFNRKAYEFNAMIQTIPSSRIALAAGKKEVPLFALDDQEAAGIAPDWGNE